MIVMVCGNKVEMQTEAGMKSINLIDLYSWEKDSVERALKELGFKCRVESNCYRMQWSISIKWECDIKEFDDGDEKFESPLYYLNCSAKWEY